VSELTARQMTTFVMKGSTPELVNKYDCSSCLESGRTHEVIDVAGPFTGPSSCWGSGLPTTKRHCTGCGFEDGPWISAELVGGGW